MNDSILEGDAALDHSIGFLLTYNANKNDWLLAIEFGETVPEAAPYSIEELTAEVIAQLAWRLRENGRPAIVTDGSLAPPRNDVQSIDMEYARSPASFHSPWTLRVDSDRAHLLLPNRLPQMRMAAAELPIMYAVIYPDFPQTATVMSVIEYSEGIALRTSADVRRIVERTARDLDLVVRDARLTAVEPASFLDRIEEKGRERLAVLDQPVASTARDDDEER